MNATSNAKAAHRAAVPCVKAWGVSLEEWLTSERDMDIQNDSDRWIAEREGEASDAVTLTLRSRSAREPA